MKLIHITDTHFVAPGQHLYGLDPRARLDAAIEDINVNHSDAQMAVITGDLTHWGEIAAYANLVECLGALSIPVVPIMGNHDNREVFAEVFSEFPLDPNGFAQHSLETDAGTFLFLDTTLGGTHEGCYCEYRRAWLSQQLDATDGPVFLFMHHPPFDIGIKSMDRIGIIQQQQFGEVVEPHRHKIRHLFYGHVHRPMNGSWMGIPFSTIRGTNHQVWLDMKSDGDEIPFTYEEPAYAVVLIGDKTVVVHTHDYCYDKGVYPSRLTGSEEEQKAYALGFEPPRNAA